MTADACALAYSDANPRQFSKTVGKSSCKKANRYVNKIDDNVGEENICTMWFDHALKMLYNSIPDNGAKASFDSTCTPLLDQFSDISVTVQDICDALRLQKKVSVLDQMDWQWSHIYIYACSELWIHLILFLQTA